MDLFNLSGRTALITGASGGLGGHFAQTLAKNGAHIVLAARRLDKLEALAAEIEGKGGAATCVAMDVTSPDSVEGAFAEIKEALGRPCDIIVNNSGLSREDFFTRQSEDDWNLVIDTNLSGVWRVAKHGAKAMLDAETPGSIINIASITGLRPTQTTAAYSASKAAVDHMTRIMALEMARYKVRVNAIAPGYFLTDINRDFFDTEGGDAMKKRITMRRLGDTNELDGPLLLLASEAGSYMTGTTVVVDGGHTLSSL